MQDQIKSLKWAFFYYYLCNYERKIPLLSIPSKHPIHSSVVLKDSLLICFESNLKILGRDREDVNFYYL